MTAGALSAWVVGALVTLAVASLGRPGPLRSAPRRATPRRRLGDGVAAVGRVPRALAGRPADPRADARLGRALAVGLALVVLQPVVALTAGLVVWAWPLEQARRARRQAARAVVDGLPEAIDLFSVAAGAGLTVPLAVATVAAHVDEPFGEALRAVERQRSLGLRPFDALEGLLELGEPTRPLVAALISSERDGAPLAGPLAQVSADARAARQRAAEEDARRLPVQLLFPLVLCILPAFGALTVVPLLASTLASLDL